MSGSDEKKRDPIYGDKKALRRDVIRGWWDLYFVEQSLAVIDENLQRLREFNLIAQSRYRVGEGLQQDILQAQMALSTQLENQIRINNQKRKKIIGGLFFDIAGIVDHYDGEVHRYIGDGMVINWDLSKTPATPDILSCLAAIYDTVEQHRLRNEPIYNVYVDLRAGLHDGPVFICEFGDQKRELVYFGDAINIAAALESYCKTAGVRAAISSKLYKKLNASPLFYLSKLGEVIMKDKLEPVECFALHPITTQPSITTNGSESKILSSINNFPIILRKAWRKS